MPSLKYYVGDWNGILTELKTKVQLATPRDADVWCVYQDCQGSYADILKTQKLLGYNKRTYCVQHGRAATLDYGEPNCFTGYADTYLCWGQADYARMVSLGLGDKTKIVGCPLNKHIKPKVQHKEKVVLFVPVNTGKEEPENIAIYYELMKIKYEKAKIKVLKNRL